MKAAVLGDTPYIYILLSLHPTMEDTRTMDVKTMDVKTPQMAPPNAKWNTKNLIPRLATDATAAIASAVTVAPLITIIDKYV